MCIAGLQLRLRLEFWNRLEHYLEKAKGKFSVTSSNIAAIFRAPCCVVSAGVLPMLYYGNIVCSLQPMCENAGLV